MKPTNRYFRFKHLISLIMLATSNLVWANPDLHAVTAGEATVTQTANTTQINQTSQKAVIEWNRFNIGVHETTHFQQPAGGVTLNRINANHGPSFIFGKLTATGQIILVNGSGFYFGSTASVNVGGLVASTANISNANFLNGQYHFDQPSWLGVIVNRGTIKAADYGLVALLGTHIENSGIIQAKLGHVMLATGQKFILDFHGDQLINFSVDGATAYDGQIINTGKILADGGRVLVTAQAAGCVLDNVINMAGLVQANAVNAQNGEIIFSTNGGVKVYGKVVASSGNIGIQAKHIYLKSTSHLNVSGELSGGTINLGNRQLTTSIYAERSSQLNASAWGMDGFGGSINLNAAHLQLAGLVTVASMATNGVGGMVSMSADAIKLKNGASVDARGELGGGRITLGNNPLIPINPPTQSILLERGSVMSVAALGENAGGGRILLNAMKTTVDGTLSAAAKGNGGFAGKLEVYAESTLKILANAKLDASGDSGGGTIYLGADFNGAGFAPHADFTTIASGSKIDASAIQNGAGGVVVVWGENTTNFAGSILAKGGAISGDGGAVQLIGGNLLTNTGTIDVSAVNGLPGTVSYAID